MVEVGRGGTEQARFEREVIFDTIAQRLVQLHLGDATLVFGRIDTEPETEPGTEPRVPLGNGSEPPSSNGNGSGGDHVDPATGETYYIGRVAVADPNQEVVVVDWRAPVAEPFYRATGRSPKTFANA